MEPPLYYFTPRRPIRIFLCSACGTLALNTDALAVRFFPACQAGHTKSGGGARIRAAFQTPSSPAVWLLFRWR